MSRVRAMRPPVQKGQKNAKVPALRNAAKDETCKLRIPGICSGDSARTVGSHMRLFNMAGTGHKPDDIFLIDACDNCHAAIEDRSQWQSVGLTWQDVLRAFMLTLKARRDAGLILLKGEN